MALDTCKLMKHDALQYPFHAPDVSPTYSASQLLVVANPGIDHPERELLMYHGFDSLEQCSEASVVPVYPLVNIQKAMENHHL